MNACEDCKYYKEKEEHYTLGKCEFPVPAWLYESRYVNGYEAETCLVYESETPRDEMTDGELAER